MLNLNIHAQPPCTNYLRLCNDVPRPPSGYRQLITEFPGPITSTQPLGLVLRRAFGRKVMRILDGAHTAIHEQQLRAGDGVAGVGLRAVVDDGAVGA